MHSSTALKTGETLRLRCGTHAEYVVPMCGCLELLPPLTAAKSPLCLAVHVVSLAVSGTSGGHQKPFGSICTRTGTHTSCTNGVLTTSLFEQDPNVHLCIDHSEAAEARSGVTLVCHPYGMLEYAEGFSYRRALSPTVSYHMRHASLARPSLSDRRALHKPCMHGRNGQLPYMPAKC